MNCWQQWNFKDFKNRDCVIMYTGKFNYDYPTFTCDKCGKSRKSTHEFLVFETVEKANQFVNTLDGSLWNSAFHYGTECVKDFIRLLESGVAYE